METTRRTVYETISPGASLPKLPRVRAGPAEIPSRVFTRFHPHPTLGCATRKTRASFRGLAWRQFSRILRGRQDARFLRRRPSALGNGHRGKNEPSRGTRVRSSRRQRMDHCSQRINHNPMSAPDARCGAVSPRAKIGQTEGVRFNASPTCMQRHGGKWARERHPRRREANVPHIQRQHRLSPRGQVRDLTDLSSSFAVFDDLWPVAKNLQHLLLTPEAGL